MNAKGMKVVKLLDQAGEDGLRAFGPYRVVLAHAGHIGADWHVGSFEQSSVGIPHVVGGAMVVDAVMSMVGVGLGDAVVEAVLPGWEAINAGGHAMEAHA